MRSVISVLAAAMILLPVLSVCAEHPPRYQGKDLEQRMNVLRGVTVEIQPVRSRYVQGEDVFLHYRIRCQPPRSDPWDVWRKASGIFLWRNGIKLRHNTIGSPEWGEPGGDMMPEHEGTFLEQANVDTMSWAEFGFMHLLPGQYTGYFDQGVQSNDFEFEVIPPPDLLLSYWRTLCALKRLTRFAESIDSQVRLDSTQLLIQQFIERPRNSLWRKEALRSALHVMGILNDMWQPGDSLICANMVTELAYETEYDAGWVCASAGNTIFAKLAPIQKAEAMLELARRIGRQDVIKAAENWKTTEMKWMQEQE